MSAPKIPTGGTWFDTHKTSFVKVTIDPKDQGIPTTEFLEAAEATTTLFDLLGSVAFNPLKNDMLGNVKKIRDRQLFAPQTSETLQALVVSELAQKSPKTHTATEGLLWLTRALDFTAQSLRHDLTANANIPANAPKPNQELADSFRAGYKTSLGPHHSWMVKPVFSAAMAATPYRKDYYAKMVDAQASPDKGMQDMEQWVSALEEKITILKVFLDSKDAKW